MSDHNKVKILFIYHKERLDKYEDFSIKTLFKNFDNSQIIVVHPDNIDNPFPKCDSKSFDKKHFKSRKNYSQLLLSRKFYNSFIDLQFIVIYQLDCIFLSNNIEYFCDTGYDYIGAPFFRNIEYPSLGLSRVGNGGLSIRKVESFLSVLNSKRMKSLGSIIVSNFGDRKFWDIKKKFQIHRHAKKGIDSYIKGYTLNEDLFWSDRAHIFFPKFRVAPIEIGLKFSFEAHPSVCYNKNNKQLPLGAHGWNKWDRGFWKKRLLN